MMVDGVLILKVSVVGDRGKWFIKLRGIEDENEGADFFVGLKPKTQ